jgi:hypothetical protein
MYQPITHEEYVMKTKMKSFSLSIMLSVALFLTLSAAPASAQMHSATVTKIKVNGLFAQTFLFDPALNAQGGLVASKDQIDNTSALDFSYAIPDPTNPDQVILFQGAGEIPNSAFTITQTTAHLAVTTSASYFINRCVINTVTGSFVCAPGTPKSFDLTWVKNGVGTTTEKTTRVDTIGPVTTKLKGDFTIKTANVNGTWDGFSNVNVMGTLQDTQSMTFIREITVAANP